jgi:hypothetical protein
VPLGWSHEEPAAKSGRGAERLKNVEFRSGGPKLATVQKWRRALESAGVKFIDADDQNGPGVRLRGIQKR